MIGIHNDSRVGVFLLLVSLIEISQVLVVIIGMTSAELVHISSENSVGIRVTLGDYLPSSEKERMSRLCRSD